ncbi:hypothetical protein OUZ56_020916 [Daphnia magna]|uniref:Uncharacterized protein n=1 Tax=Daphnia magna TaxID=35525 RepID=A0ABQ9ZFW1_9CRUS|nr:hypothetical protein OUZ56_020916 [Daphnia magna]
MCLTSIQRSCDVGSATTNFLTQLAKMAPNFKDISQWIQIDPVSKKERSFRLRSDDDKRMTETFKLRILLFKIFF